MRSFKTRTLKTALALLGAVGLAWGCSGDKAAARGQIMVAFDTDMTVPRDVSKVNIQIKVNGRIEFSNEYEVGPGGKVRLPATLAIVAPEGGTSAPVTIKVVGLKGTTARTLRQVVTKVPSDRIALLPMKVQWLCDGSAVTAGPEEYASTCPTEGQSCEAGSCVPDEIPVEALPSYEAKSVFGGASDPNQGTCFDTVACFAQGFGVTPRSSDCTIDPIGGADGAVSDPGLSFAMVRPPDTEGICGPEACLVPLDAESTAGWRKDEASGRIVFPQAVCTRLAEGKILGVAATKTCPTKTSSLPVCGDWSSVPTNPGTFDAGAPPLEAGHDDGGDGAAADCPALQAAAEAALEAATSCDTSSGCIGSPLTFACQSFYIGALSEGSGALATANDAISAYQAAGCAGTCLPDAGQQGGAPACVDVSGQLKCRVGGSGGAAPSCYNGTKDSNEKDVDCGGPCGPCSLGRTCSAPADCASGWCDSGTSTCDCPLDMVRRASAGGVDYCIDRYEVTKAVYDAYLVVPPNPAEQPPECQSVNVDPADWTPQFGWPVSGDGALPVVGVDWCDAYMFCLNIGKRLCGRPGGGSTAYARFDDATESCWYGACSEAGSVGALAGDNPSACNTQADGLGTAVDGMTLTGCETPAGVFNLSGNVGEWEDACNGKTGGSDSCQVRGGNYNSPDFDVMCAAQAPSTRATVDQYIGFRCCGGDARGGTCDPATCPAGPGQVACCAAPNGPCGVRQAQGSCTSDADCDGTCAEGHCVDLSSPCFMP
ncbi:MAG: SUMF1/EgtB/PvdO family nonheme iron enzyme [Polyangiaceae bacterium]|nr:SUMF1/EgtB/PvdO family nonheme iron enzyme [Polyangiaceae bacterium]